MRHNSFIARPSRRGFKPRFARGSMPRGNRGPAGQYIHPDRFINKAQSGAIEAPYVATHRFSDFGLLPSLVATLTKRGYVTPTPIQDKTITESLAGKDIIGIANTGTGKTAAFVLPMIQRLLNDPRHPHALVIAPTRELAKQINDEFRSFAHGQRLYSVLCIGGVNINRQISELRRQPQVVIGTPGRLVDLFKQQVLRLETTRIVVLDEVDRMCDMGFITDIRFLLGQLPTPHQSLCFSATLTPEIRQLLNQFMVNPLQVSVRTEKTSEQINQDVIRVPSGEQKFTILADLLKKTEFHKVLVFGRTKWGVQKLAAELCRSGITAEAIHGNKSQPQRQRALQAFKEDRVSVLVATDVAARGLDIPLVSHVINYDQPSTYDDYIHRIGRTGRAGQTGQALTFIE